MRIMATGQGGGCLIQDRAADNGYRTGRRIMATGQGGGCLIQDRAAVGGGS